MKTKLFASLAFIMLLQLQINAQPFHWKLGGNNTMAPDPVGFGNNYLGTNAATPVTLRLGTNGTNRMIIFDGGVGNNDGRIVIGNNLPAIGFAPSARLHLHQTGGFNNAIRFTTQPTLPTASDGLLIGNDFSGFAFMYNFEDDQPLTFGTENASTPFNPVERMRINADNLNGFIGIGSSAKFFSRCTTAY